MVRMPWRPLLETSPRRIRRITALCTVRGVSFKRDPPTDPATFSGAAAARGHAKRTALSSAAAGLLPSHGVDRRGLLGFPFCSVVLSEMQSLTAWLARVPSSAT